jgi:S-adenosyl methyltransferase
LTDHRTDDQHAFAPNGADAQSAQATQASHPAQAAQPSQPPDIDPTKAHIARVYNYWLGGKDNYAADQKAAEQVIAAYPNIRTSVRAQRAFLGRAVHYLASEAGIRQFLDVGTGLPSANNTHEVAQREAPESRIVYVDHDPVVLAHARALLTSSPEGATAYIDSDLRDTSKILQEAAGTLDFSQPVAVMLVGVLHCIPDADGPTGIVAKLMAAVPSGSYLVIAHPASDVDVAQVSTATTRFNRLAAEPVTLRTHAEVSRFFEGLGLLEPGLVQLHRWRAGAADGGLNLANYGAVARKP